jgi:hypothetical protein
MAREEAQQCVADAVVAELAASLEKLTPRRDDDGGGRA